MGRRRNRFTALLTALGAATVFFFRSRPDPTVHRIFLGFAAGVMIAASMWSLLIPAIEEAEAMGMVGWVPGRLGVRPGHRLPAGHGRPAPPAHP